MPETTSELHEAINQFWQGIEPQGGMAIKWTLTIEGIDADGDRGLEYVWSEDLRTWELKGMLHSALDAQVSIETAYATTGEDDA